MLLGVSFHYVARERSADAVAVFPITVAEFAEQLDELGRIFEFVGRDDLVRAAEGTGTLPERACAITFDDGLRQQFDLALPALEERGIPAIFFVSGAPLAEGRVAYTHKVHLLRETMGDARLREALEGELRAGGSELDSLWPSERPSMYPYDTPEAAQLKYLLNFTLGAHRSEPIDAIFAREFSEQDVASSLYMPASQVAELESMGALGAHGYDHVPLATLEPDVLADDLKRSSDALAEVTGRAPRTMSYPYGTADAVDARVAAAAAAAGFAVSFTMERAVNATLDEPLLLARVDTNDAPGGRRPRVTFENGAVRVDAPVTRGRARYLSEPVA